jgi:hypothetical protein
VRHAHDWGAAEDTPVRMISLIFASVLNSLKKSAPDRGGIVSSGDCGFGTPPRPFGPWQLMHPYLP